MEKSKELVQQAGIVPNLQLAIKKPSGGVMSTGPHTVKVIDEKLITTTNYDTGKSVPTMRYFFDEKGDKKQWDVEVKDANGNLDYKIQKMAQFEKGQMIILECIRKGVKNYIDIRPADPEEKTGTDPFDDIPIINEEDTEKTFEERLQE